jgi:hypothetical protein
MGYPQVFDALLKDIENPRFLAWIEAREGRFPIQPDPQDLDESVVAETEEEQAHQWRLAQARKMLRLYRVWKADQEGGAR